MDDNADGSPGDYGRSIPRLWEELGASVHKRRIEQAITTEALLAELSSSGSPITDDELAALESGESIDWAEPGLRLIAALAFLFEVSSDEALQDSEPFVKALAKSANLQQKYVHSAAGIDAGMSEAMLESLGLPVAGGDLARMEAGEIVAWADPGLRLAAALARTLDISLDQVVVTALRDHFGEHR